MPRLSIYFTAPRHVDVRQEDLPPLTPDQLLVETLFSAISPGTEALIYRGLFPEDLAVDESIRTFSGSFGYPLKYGYCAVGRVKQIGKAVDPAWSERLVFAFNPHESHFVATVEELIPLPDGIEPEEAVFLPNMETAVNFVMDGKPIIGERVVVFGQGIVGLLTTALLSQFPLRRLITLDRYPLRRQASLALGAYACLDPAVPETFQLLQSLCPEGADLVYELSGSPAALNDAIAATGFDGRIIIGSWYGQKQASLDLGGQFHRSRIQLKSSQVSTLAAEFSGRWTKARRFETTWEMLRKVEPFGFITQRFHISQAAQAYRLLDEHPEETIQIVFTYS